MLDISALMAKSLLHDDSGVSVIIGAMLLILITIVAAAGLALIVSQTEKQAADRQAQINAVNSEDLKIASMTLTNDTPPSDNNVDNLALDIMNLNKAESRIMALIVNGKYVTNYTLVSGAPDFTANKTSRPGNLTVQFNDTSQDFPTGWDWNFGDPDSGSNNIANVQNPVHYYANPGNYSVTLNVTGSTGNDSVTKMNYIRVTDPNLNYAVNFSSNFTIGNTGGMTVQFYDNSTCFTNNNWSWTFGDGDTSNLQNPTHTYPATVPADYTVTLSVNNGSANMIKKEYIIIGKAPNPNYNYYFEPRCGKVPLKVDFVDSSSYYPTSWDWNFGDPDSGGSNTANTRNPSHIYDTPGLYTVTLNVTNANEQSTCTQTFMISSPVQDSMPMTIGGGGHTYININKTVGTSKGLGITNDQPITIQIVTSYINYFKTVYNPPSAIEKVNVETQNLGLQGSRDYLVLDGSDSISTNGTIVSWSWDISNTDKTINIPMNGRITKLSPPTNDGYLVSLTVIDSNGMTATSGTTSIPSDSNFNPVLALAPVVDFLANPTSGIANGSPVPVQFTDNSSNNPTSWVWYFGDGNQSAEKNPVHSYYAGNWTVSLIATNAGGSSTMTRYGYIKINSS